MDYFEIRMSKGDEDEDDYPEVAIEFYYQKDWTAGEPPIPEMSTAASISSSKKNGVYDVLSNKADVNGDGNDDAADKKILLDLANAFAKIAPETFKN